MSKKFIYIRMNGSDPKVLVQDYHKSLAYEISDDKLICISKDETKMLPYAWTDIATGCSFGHRFKTLKEAKEFSQEPSFKVWLEKMNHTRKFTSSYHELIRQKQVFLRHWSVKDGI